jgi:hypothetical protein
LDDDESAILTVSLVDPLETEMEALDVQVLEREVVLLGPRVAVALSAAAAAETAKRLADAAAIASRAEISSPQASQAFSRDA